MDPGTLRPLTEMGLTGLEAQAYAFLLENAPATGYGVAKGLGKPTANTYKAIESLFDRGAILREEGEHREYRPVEPDELLGALERQFAERKEQAAAQLRELKGRRQDDRVYRLQTPEQVLERMRHMLGTAEHCALLDLFPWAVDALGAEIERTAARGVDVTVKLYQATDLAGVRSILDADAAVTTDRWPGQWANGVVDGRQHMMAWLSADGAAVHQAVWSASLFLSWVFHTALVNEMLIGLVEEAIDADRSVREMADDLEALKRHTHAFEAPGYRELIRRGGP